MTKSTLYGAVLAAAVAATPLVGCERRTSTQADLPSEPPAQTQSEPTARGGGPVDVSGAVDRIVEARCAREAKCGAIGGDRKWASYEACSEVVSREYADDLSAEECPAGVDAKELDECVREAANADCGNPIDVIGRVAACRTSDLCRDSAAR